MKTAKFIKEESNGKARAKIYKVDPPIPWNDYSIDGGKEHLTDYIRVSAAIVPLSGYETFIFPCDETGDPVNWLELSGSRRGFHTHEEIVEGIGYTIVE